MTKDFLPFTYVNADMYLFKHYSIYVFDITGNTKSQRRRKQQLSHHSLKMHNF